MTDTNRYFGFSKSAAKKAYEGWQQSADNWQPGKNHLGLEGNAFGWSKKECQAYADFFKEIYECL